MLRENVAYRNYQKATIGIGYKSVIETNNLSHNPNHHHGKFATIFINLTCNSQKGNQPPGASKKPLNIMQNNTVVFIRELFK